MTDLAALLMGSSQDEAALQARLRRLTLLTFVGALVVAGLFAAMVLSLQQVSRHREAESIAARHSALLEERVSRALSSTYALAAVLQENDGQFDNFEALATELLRLYGGISSLQLARDGVVSHVVPFVGNSQAIGHDLLADQMRNREARLAMETRQLTLAGPFELLQGGLALVGRLPVFLPAGDGRFWGFTTAVLRIDELLLACKIDQLEQEGFQYELAKLEADNGRAWVFARSSREPLVKPVTRTLNVPNGRWQLSVAPTEGWLPAWMWWISATGALLVAALGALLAHSVFMQPLLLRREVDQRTRELAEANRALSAEADGRERAQQALQKINRLYSLLIHTNAALMQPREREALVHEVCRIAVELGGFPLARVAMREDGGWRWVARHGEDRDLEDCKQALIHCTHHDPLLEQPALLRVCSEAPAPGGQSFPPCPTARMAGFLSHVFLPLRVRGTVVGVFSLYGRESGLFDTDQLRLLEEVADNLSFVLEHIECEQEQRATDEHLRKLSCAVDQCASAVLITAHDGSIEYVNPKFTQLTGYTLEEVAGQTPRVFRSPHTSPETHRHLWSAITSGKEWNGELCNRRKNGEHYWCLQRITPLKDASGKVTHFIAAIEDISERKQTEQTIRHLAMHDPLSGLPNRRLFTDRLHQAAAARRSKEKGLALFLFDLDRFKTINDTLGHDIGDALLRAGAERLQSCIREGDTLARMGGDEFGLLAPGIVNPDEAAAMAAKLLDALRAPFHLFGHQLHVTTSIGIALYPADATDAEVLIKHADIALYRAKDLGRNNYSFFTADMNVAIQQRLRLESAMRIAVERGEFRLHYQPQVDQASGRIHSCEALVRWRHPELGMVSPAQFIPLAEENGMIVTIGEWILRTACAQARIWMDAGVPTRIAVNLSARQFHQGDLAEVVAALLSEFGLPPDLLELELTEGIVMEDTARTSAVLEKLHAMGVHISIDDFGTGYSSLSYLKRLPIHVLKIDQSFVREIHTDADDRAIVAAVIALAHSLQLKVVAEGVETKEQWAFLRERACDSMQGYLFSKPLPADAAYELLCAQRRFSLEEAGPA